MRSFTSCYGTTKTDQNASSRSTSITASEVSCCTAESLFLLSYDSLFTIEAELPHHVRVKET